MKIKCVDCGTLYKEHSKGWMVVVEGSATCQDCRNKRGWLASLEVGDKVHDCGNNCTFVKEIALRDKFLVDSQVTYCEGMICLEPCDCSEKYLSPFSGKIV